ncbi:hypothetical protein Bca4012_100885 [Brassica carinata]
MKWRSQLEPFSETPPGEFEKDGLSINQTVLVSTAMNNISVIKKGAEVIIAQGGGESVDTPALDRCLMTRPSHLRPHHQDHNMRPQPQLRTESVAKGLLWRLKQNRRLAQLEG